ncbi:MAG: replication-associated recombination protein A, partial [Gammaproteobacteria bacterium]|nr:replication-associated recombination protein A [Gammaproteobacteria bacterium]
MRPRTLDEFVGQTHLLSKDKPLRVAIEHGKLHSMIFWGPPGTGKTTLARIISNTSDAQFIPISAVLSGVKEIRQSIDQAKAYRQGQDSRTVLFVDEVHRFNKAQQDAFLPHIEDGTIYFIGATTENPSFELNNALLSRARTYVLKRLTHEDIQQCIEQAIQDKEQGLNGQVDAIEREAKEMLAVSADGDARRALNFLEIAVDLLDENANKKTITKDIIQEVTSQSLRRFDKQGEYFYDQISALHKSVRGSDPDAALYWFCRMIDGGCDPHYIARRVVRMASEDIGNADPRGLQITVDAWNTYDRLGSPEGELAIAHAIVYLSCVPKSNAVYTAYKAAMSDAK